jgi:hypothetical protein
MTEPKDQGTATKGLTELSELADRLRWNPELAPPDDERDPAAIPRWAYDWLVDVERKHDALARDFQAHLYWGSVMGGLMAVSILVAFAYLFAQLGVLQ